MRQADIVVENFRPGVLDKLGLGWELLSTENPGLVGMVRLSGFGQTGPMAKQSLGFGAIGESMGGLRYVTGFPDRAAGEDRHLHRRPIARSGASSAR